MMALSPVGIRVDPRLPKTASASEYHVADFGRCLLERTETRIIRKAPSVFRVRLELLVRMVSKARINAKKLRGRGYLCTDRTCSQVHRHARLYAVQRRDAEAPGVEVRTEFLSLSRCRTFNLNAAVMPVLSSYAGTRVASSFTISVPRSSASQRLWS